MRDDRAMLPEYVRKHLVMPSHDGTDETTDKCPAGWRAGYVTELLDGRWHCNRCGYVCDPDDA